MPTGNEPEWRSMLVTVQCPNCGHAFDWRSPGPIAALFHFWKARGEIPDRAEELIAKVQELDTHVDGDDETRRADSDIVCPSCEHPFNLTHDDVEKIVRAEKFGTLLDQARFYVPVLANDEAREAFRTWLAAAMARGSLNQTKLAELSGVDQSVISKILAGRQKRPSNETVTRLVITMGISENANLAARMLFGGDADIYDVPAAVGASLPLVGYLGIDDLYYPDPAVGRWQPFAAADPTVLLGSVGLVVRGDSMEPAYRDGDIVCVRPRMKDPHSLAHCIGRDCVVQVKGGDAMLKHVKPGDDKGVVLVSYNPTIEEIAMPAYIWMAPVEWVKKGSPS